MSHKENLNVVFLGHVDCGKSTIIGHFAQLLGKVTEKEMLKREKESNELGKGSFKYAWVLDKNRGERERGITINTSHLNIELKSKMVNMIDVPGHRDFMKNLLAGVSQADIAVIVIAATTGEFEVGISKDGQTREHLLIASAMGIKRLIILVNKMDGWGVKFSVERFHEIKKEMQRLLKKHGFNPKSIPFIPISGWCGHNLTEPHSTDMQWYKGETLLSTLESLKCPIRDIELPLRIPILDIHKISGIGIVPVGRIETGRLVKNQVIKFSHSDDSSKVYSIESFWKPREVAMPGHLVGFNVKGFARHQLHRGMVVGDPNNDPPCLASRFTAKITILNHPGKLKEGYTPVFYIHTANCSCRFDKILKVINPDNADEIIDENPTFITKGQTAIVVVKPSKPLSVEIFGRYSRLSRFVIRDLRQTIGFGIIKSVEKFEK
ncbi:elongation factor 1-alpha 1 [Anaeramoeba flamelloides]|uniref:Elongation factor 1-alpha 1 n=1 Tax=Anaeramoeba flamelloides TaxID=1746091 RepID=A0ABQ8XRN2_9EUKA|nr:elongation factor 1-alpha 1 [Anaeramoeba flamelloides]